MFQVSPITTKKKPIKDTQKKTKKKSKHVTENESIKHKGRKQEREGVTKNAEGQKQLTKWQQ